MASGSGSPISSKPKSMRQSIIDALVESATVDDAFPGWNKCIKTWKLMKQKGWTKGMSSEEVLAWRSYHPQRLFNYVVSQEKVAYAFLTGGSGKNFSATTDCGNSFTLLKSMCRLFQMPDRIAGQPAISNDDRYTYLQQFLNQARQCILSYDDLTGRDGGALRAEEIVAMCAGFAANPDSFSFEGHSFPKPVRIPNNAVWFRDGEKFLTFVKSKPGQKFISDVLDLAADQEEREKARRHVDQLSKSATLDDVKDLMESLDFDSFLSTVTSVLDVELRKYPMHKVYYKRLPRGAMLEKLLKTYTSDDSVVAALKGWVRSAGIQEDLELSEDFYEETAELIAELFRPDMFGAPVSVDAAAGAFVGIERDHLLDPGHGGLNNERNLALISRQVNSVSCKGNKVWLTLDVPKDHRGPEALLKELLNNKVTVYGFLGLDTKKKRGGLSKATKECIEGLQSKVKALLDKASAKSGANLPEGPELGPRNDCERDGGERDVPFLLPQISCF